jgi:hypothetical protein
LSNAQGYIGVVGMNGKDIRFHHAPGHAYDNQT